MVYKIILVYPMSRFVPWQRLTWITRICPYKFYDPKRNVSINDKRDSKRTEMRAGWLCLVGVHSR